MQGDSVLERLSGLVSAFNSVSGVKPLSYLACLALACLIHLPVAAQEADDEEEQAEEEQAQAASTAQIEEVIVTGSRLRRNTYTSVSPLQIISAEVKREAGLVDAGEIIQESTASAGQQIDLTFNGFVLDDGPGAVTANLRGLAPGRTLLLINGRRIAPAGVEGAPTNPDLGIVPGLLVSQYDELLDGASSIYGSDAIAGVVNAILQTDFDGFRLDAHTAFPAHGAGDTRNLSLRWGRNFDRGFIGFAAQYADVEAVTLDDRPWTAGCQRHYEEDQAGQVRTQDIYYSTIYGMEWDNCTLGQGALVGRVVAPAPRYSIYYTPGYTNGGWPDFSESNVGSIGVDGDGDGRTDLSFRDYSLNGRTQFEHLASERTTTNAMLYGEYTLEGEMNLTPYFEVLHATRETFTDTGVSQLWPDVPADNPFNICNPNGQGVDCGLANDALLTNPSFEDQFRDFWGATCAGIGVPRAGCIPSTFGWLGGPIGPAVVYPVVGVRGDRTLVSTDITSWRYVAGLQGDLPFLSVGSLSNWTFDFSVTASRSEGTSSRPGIRKDRLELALGYYSENWTPCENNISAETRETRGGSRNDNLLELQADVAPGCVPVNLFAPSLFSGLIGDFATPEERDYVFGLRDFVTEYDQTVFNLFVTGDVFDMPAGPAAAGVGVEYRIDEINSIPNAVARDGLMWGFFADGGAVGEKYTREAFAETELPLFADKPGLREMTLNLSVRWTDDEFYGGAWTRAVKLGYRPVESLLLRVSSGTSYRAPNMRELFLRSQTGFGSLYDPCLVPEAALGDLTGEYDPALDDREPHWLENCRAQGVDPLAFTLGFNSYSVEQAAGGSLALDEEKSESLSAGFAWEQPFTTAFDLNVGMSYYEIEIEDTIIEPTGGYIVFDCYMSETSAHTFCDRITRSSNPERPLMTLIDRGFVNRDSEKVRGVDLNIAFDQTFTVFERALDVSLDVTAHRQIERSTLFINSVGDRDVQRDHREWYYPEHKAQFVLRLDYDRWRLTWSSRYVGNQYQDAGRVDGWNDVNGSAGSGVEVTDTCLGPPTDLLCRDVGDVDDYWVHHASVTYRANTWLVRGGARNVFDAWPPQVDWSEWATDVNNTPIGAGYDWNGRTLFLAFEYSFGRE